MEIKKKKGMVLILVIIVMTAVLLLVTYFLDFVITESKIAQSHTLATQTYYLTEAGIQEAIWKLKNDVVWNENFTTDPNWSNTIEHQNPFNENETYEVHVANVEIGRAEILSTGNINLGDRQSQRIIKTEAYQAQGSSSLLPEQAGIFIDEDINFSGAEVNIINGGLFANDDINLTYFSNINIDKDAVAVNDIIIPWGSSLTANELISSNYPPAPDNIDIPEVDFNSANVDSLKNQADQVYTKKEFDNLLSSNPIINLAGVIYVTGNINIPRGVILNIDGALISEGNINMGDIWWPFWKSLPSLFITDPGTGPVGLISKRNINLQSQADTVDIDGLIYAINIINLEWLSPEIDLLGGIIARKINVSNSFRQINIIFSNDIIIRTLGIAADSPIINIEHWEEEY